LRVTFIGAQYGLLETASATVNQLLMSSSKDKKLVYAAFPWGLVGPLR
jgi:hypothetical protein